MKRKLLYQSLSGDARIWFRSLDVKCRLDWECLRKAFYLKYYTPKEAYDDRCHIYNFWPHVGESIAQAWGRLNDLIRKNPCHGIPDSLILINFYVRLPSIIGTFWIIHLKGVLLIELNKKQGIYWILLLIIQLHEILIKVMNLVLILNMNV